MAFAGPAAVVDAPVGRPPDDETARSLTEQLRRYLQIRGGSRDHAPSPDCPILREAPTVAGTPPPSRYYLAVLFPLTEARIRQLLRHRGSV